MDLELIQPGKPTQNSYIERFNRTFRREALDFYVFTMLREAREIVEDWLKQYNEQRPPKSLTMLTDVTGKRKLYVNVPRPLGFSLGLSSPYGSRSQRQTICPVTFATVKGAPR